MAWPCLWFELLFVMSLAGDQCLQLAYHDAVIVVLLLALVLLVAKHHLVLQRAAAANNTVNRDVTAAVAAVQISWLHKTLHDESKHSTKCELVILLIDSACSLPCRVAVLNRLLCCAAETNLLRSDFLGLHILAKITSLLNIETRHHRHLNQNLYFKLTNVSLPAHNAAY